MGRYDTGMSIPQVAIVGRPNVGKSSLFNWLARRRLAIVDDYEGVTRDRMTTVIAHEPDDAPADQPERNFELVDTGGIGVVDVDDLSEDVRHQIEFAIDSADVILLVVDAQTGPMPLDHEVTERLRGLEVPIILVVNKADQKHDDRLGNDFHVLGQDGMIAVSTTQNRRRTELLDLIVDRLPPPMAEDAEDPVMKVTIVGRRNVGKSTFVNTLVDSPRMIVSEVAGTTRDSVDVQFELDGQTFIAIDTPGLRKRKSQRTDLEFYGMHRAQRSIRRADVVLMFFDGSENVSKVDKQLIGYVIDHHKPCIFVVNKWDLVKDTLPTERWVRYLRETFPTLAFAPIAFITGQTGKNVKTLLNHATMLFKQSRSRTSTGQLNRIITAAVEAHQPPLYQNRRPKIYYATQVATAPPTVVLMCNEPSGLTKDYQRYLINVLRDNTDYGEVPIRMYLEKRKRGEPDPDPK